MISCIATSAGLEHSGQSDLYPLRRPVAKVTKQTSTFILQLFINNGEVVKCLPIKNQLFKPITTKHNMT